jgi:DNA-binding NarL/FixJ family response regulator
VAARRRLGPNLLSDHRVAVHSGGASRADVLMASGHTASAVRVLLVEDQLEVREAIAAEFESHPDLQIVADAASLAEARQMLATADVVLLDLGLPDGSGTDLLPELWEVNPNARAIVLSATSDPAQRRRALEHGAAAVLDKIKHLGQVSHAVREVLAGQSP